MTNTALPQTQTRAILLMISAIFCFSLMDAGVKALAPQTGVIPTLWARYAGQMALVLVLVLPRLRQVVQTRYPVLQVLRSVLLMGATAFFFWGISLIPLGDAAALMSLNPVLITLGAALFLRESLGPRRLTGIAVALIGALIIIRPGSSVFTMAALAPLVAAFCYSAYALLTRKVGPDEDVWTSLFYTGLIGTLILTAIVPFAWVTPDTTGILLMLWITGCGTLGQLCLIRAFSLGEASMLAPYSYTGLLFASVWSTLFFAEIPDLWTLSGMLVIAGAGLYVWHRETTRG